MTSILDELEWQDRIYSSGWRRAHGGILESVEPATGDVLARVAVGKRQHELAVVAGGDRVGARRGYLDARDGCAMLAVANDHAAQCGICPGRSRQQERRGCTPGSQVGHGPR